MPSLTTPAPQVESHLASLASIFRPIENALRDQARACHSVNQPKSADLFRQADAVNRVFQAACKSYRVAVKTEEEADYELSIGNHAEADVLSGRAGQWMTRHHRIVADFLARQGRPTPPPPGGGTGTLEIGSTTYSVEAVPSHDGPAFRLSKADGTTYDVRQTGHGAECDCGDFVYRRAGLDAAGCKHVKALRGRGMLAALVVEGGVR